MRGRTTAFALQQGTPAAALGKIRVTFLFLAKNTYVVEFLQDFCLEVAPEKCYSSASNHRICTRLKGRASLGGNGYVASVDVSFGDIDAALALTGLGDDADRLIREYSQGMRRKTALACAMVAAPPLLILDEALNGLDPPSAARVVGALRAACTAGAAVLLSTHVLDTLERVADRIVMITDGRVVADVPSSELDRIRDLF